MHIVRRCLVEKNGRARVGEMNDWLRDVTEDFISFNIADRRESLVSFIVMQLYAKLYHINMACVVLR